MFNPSTCRQRQAMPRHALLFLLGFTLLLLSPVMDSMAQGLPIQDRPTPTPTEVFDPPLQADPTPEPPRPTEDLPVQAQPTAIPTEELPVVIEEPSTLTINKGACDDSNFDAYNTEGLDAFQAACASPDGDFEFTVSNGSGFSETSMTSLGTVQFVVPTGPITITETIPGGFGEPAVFCWSNILPTVSGEPYIGNGPQWDVAEGEQIECWWFNVSADVTPGHTIRVIKHICPEGIEPADDYWALSAACADPLPGIDFSLTTGGGVVAGVTDAAGEIEWTDVDLGESGQIQLDEDVPAGYGEPIVWCVSFPVIAADAQDFDFVQIESVDGLIAALPEQHEPFIFSCAYFNIPEAGSPDDLTTTDPQEGDSGNIVTVIKHRCPMGVVEDASPFDYMEICTAEHDEIAFTLDHDGGSFPGVTASGQVQWTDVPPGDFEIQETLPAGYLDPLVFCNFTELPDGGLPQPELVPAATGLVTGAFENDGSEYVCWWFNIPDPDSNNTITLVKKVCPAGTSTASNDDGDYHVVCVIDSSGVDFTLTAPHGEFTETTNGNGLAEWTGIPLGDFSIQETIPDGYGDPVVFCNFADVIQGIGFQNGPPMRVEAPSGLVAAAIEEPNVAYFCHWFNIEDAGDQESRVVINKRICPEGVDLVLSDDNVINDIIVACPEPGDGIEFTLDNADGSSTQAISGDGGTYWDDVPDGPFTVSEDIPPGYGEPVWYCMTNVYDEAGNLDVDPTVEPGVAPGGVLTDSIDEPYGEIFGCWVFNVPEESEENSIIIHKWQCPEGTGPEESLDWYTDNCPEEHDGVDFKVASDIGIAVMETSGGQVQFDGFPAGTVGIQETIPGGFGSPVVFCAPDDSLWQPYAAPTGHWEYDFPADGISESLVCYVYNIPGEPGDVTILKWTCPEGYDLFAEGANPALDCTEATNGIEFQFGLSGLQEEAVIQTTGEVIAGGVFFDGLEPDTYKAVELVPEGIDHVFVLECTGHLMGVLQPYPLEMGNVLEIEVEAGEHLVCHWFNVPGFDPEFGRITLYKHICSTGTFVSEVDCEIYEDGQAFDLLHWNVEDGVWEVVDTGVTDGFGTISWPNLPPGDYGLDEVGGEWCHLTTLPVFGEGDFFSVSANEETVVNVYNCTGEPGKPGETPTKYPNTGVPGGRNEP